MRRSIVALLILAFASTPVDAHHRDNHSKGKGNGDSPSVSFNVGVLDGTLLKFAPIEDVAVSSKSKPRLRETELVVRKTRSEARTFLKFDVAGISGPIASARLLLRSIANSAEGGELREVETGWSEAMTWSDQPFIDFQDPPLDSVNAVGNDGYYEWDVSQVVTGDGPYAFALTCNSCSSKYASRESSEYVPYLIVVMDDAVPEPRGSAADPVLVGAGDIAFCAGDPFESGAELTAQLLDAIGGNVFTAGDNAYNEGTLDEFVNCYDPTWGRHKAATRPSPGNHEYLTPGASGYFSYFGEVANWPGGYYSYDIGDWHSVALNSNCIQIGGCGLGSPIEQWLRADLAANPTQCTVAYMHHSRFSSGKVHGSDDTFEDLVQALYDGGVDVLITAHDHLYERFAPQDPTGVTDFEAGIRAFVIGTGGRSLYAFGTPIANSEARYNGDFGVLLLTLHADSYDWDFVGVNGQFIDAGSARCR